MDTKSQFDFRPRRFFASQKDWKFFYSVFWIKCTNKLYAILIILLYDANTQCDTTINVNDMLIKQPLVGLHSVARRLLKFKLVRSTLFTVESLSIVYSCGREGENFTKFWDVCCYPDQTAKDLIQNCVICWIIINRKYFHKCYFIWNFI